MDTLKTKSITVSKSKVQVGLRYKTVWCLVDELESFWESCFDSVPAGRNQPSNTTGKTEAYEQLHLTTLTTLTLLA